MNNFSALRSVKILSGQYKFRLLASLLLSPACISRVSKGHADKWHQRECNNLHNLTREVSVIDEKAQLGAFRDFFSTNLHEIKDVKCKRLRLNNISLYNVKTGGLCF